MLVALSGIIVLIHTICIAFWRVRVRVDDERRVEERAEEKADQLAELKIEEVRKESVQRTSRALSESEHQNVSGTTLLEKLREEKRD